VLAYLRGGICFFPANPLALRDIQIAEINLYLEGPMAEPASLPVSPQRVEPIPWPQTTDPRALGKKTVLQQRSNELLEFGRAAFLRSWDSTQRALSDVSRRAGPKIRQLKRDRPVEIIATVAVAAFLLGVGLRVWRSRHE
jgi:hypothetical protein